jgi:hypothetical protein
MLRPMHRDHVASRLVTPPLRYLTALPNQNGVLGQ